MNEVRMEDEPLQEPKENGKCQNRRKKKSKK
jgi:hypothetical protein